MVDQDAHVSTICFFEICIVFIVMPVFCLQNVLFLFLLFVILFWQCLKADGWRVVFQNHPGQILAGTVILFKL